MNHDPSPALDGAVDRVGDRSSFRDRLAFGWALPFASALTSLVILTGVLCGAALLFGRAITGIEAVLAAIATGIGLAVWLRRIHGRWWPACWTLMLLAMAAVILPNLVLGGRVLDDTWDGQWLHQEAVIQLTEGWNPFWADLTAEELPNQGARIRLNGYPKASWLWGAPLYRLTGRIERSKAFSLPLMVAAAFAILAGVLIVTRLPIAVAALIGFATAANPVALTQILNAQQDGPFGSLLTITAVSLVIWVRGGSRIGLALAAAAAVGASAIKLTGPAYVGIFVFSAVAWLWWDGAWRRERRAFGVAVASAAVALFLLSGGSYLTNTTRHGHPMYPVFGPDRIDLIGLKPHNRFLTMAASVFSRSRRAPSDHETLPVLEGWTELKIPLTFDREEIRAFSDPDVRVGGWGPLFGGMSLFAVAILGITAVRRPRWAAMLVVALGPLVLSVVINPYCWKIRYVPQSWIIPLVVATAALASRSGRIEKALAWALLAASCANAVLVGWGHFPMVINHSNYLRQRLLELGHRRQALELNLEPYRSNRARLAELGIDFTEVRNPRHNLPVYLGHSPLRITRLDVEPAPGGGGSARIAWRATPIADAYLVEAVVPGPAGPGGSGLTVVRRRTVETRAEIPIPARPVGIQISNCNALGCGVAVTAGPITLTGGERSRPLIGAPYEGEVMRQPAVLLSWLPAEAPDGGQVHYLCSLFDEESGELVLERETADLWVDHRFSRDGSWRAEVRVVGSGPGEVSAVGFRTEGVAAPRVTGPPSGSTHRAGPVELVWEPVPGASSYEYFVAVTGQPTATIRDLTVSTRAEVVLNSQDGRPTHYSVIVRACLAPEGCRSGSEIGWGPWSHDAGLGDVKLTVVP